MFMHAFSLQSSNAAPNAVVAGEVGRSESRVVLIW